MSKYLKDGNNYEIIIRGFQLCFFNRGMNLTIYRGYNAKPTGVCVVYYKIKILLYVRIYTDIYEYVGACF